MNSRLEQFVRDHREEFDTEGPDKKVWEKIQLQLEPEKKRTAPLLGLSKAWWSAAAAIIVLIGATWVYVGHDRHGNESSVAAYQREHAQGPATAGTQPSASAGQNQQATTGQSNDTGATTEPGSLTGSGSPAQNNNAADPSLLAANKGNSASSPDAESENEFKEEMYHYARLAEIKYNQLKKIKKDDPLLYSQFAGEIHSLDSVYHKLENQLPGNPGKEALLQAMVENLKLQIDLLNQQLSVIHKIEQAKSGKNEKNFNKL